MTDATGICGHCGTRQRLDDAGKVEKHTKMVASARGSTRIKCSGSGTNPLK